MGNDFPHLLLNLNPLITLNYFKGYLKVFLLLFFKVFFIQKYIKIIFFYFLKIIFDISTLK